MTERTTMLQGTQMARMAHVPCMVKILNETADSHWLQLRQRRREMMPHLLTRGLQAQRETPAWDSCSTALTSRRSIKICSVTDAVGCFY